MEKLEKLKYSDFLKLLEYLTIEKEDGKTVNQQIEHFFPSLTAVQEVEFIFLANTIINNGEHSEEMFNNFKQKYPDIKIDPEGKTEPAKKKYWEIGLHSLDVAYDNAIKMLSDNEKDVSPNRVNTQVKNAKELECLVKMGKQPDSYIANRVLFLKKNKLNEITTDVFNTAEKQLKEFGFSYDVLNRLINYCKNKSPEKYYFFIKAFFQRLFYLAKDPEVENESNKIFYENLKKIEA